MVSQQARSPRTKDAQRWGHTGVRAVQNGHLSEEPVAKLLQQPSSPAFPNGSAAKGPPGPSLSHLLILLQDPRCRASLSALKIVPSSPALQGQCWAPLVPPVPTAAVAMEMPIAPVAWVFSLGAILPPSTSPFAYPGSKQVADREENCLGIRFG